MIDHTTKDIFCIEIHSCNPLTQSKIQGDLQTDIINYLKNNKDYFSKLFSIIMLLCMKCNGMERALSNALNDIVHTTCYFRNYGMSESCFDADSGHFQ